MNLGIYFVERTDGWSYDEYDSFIACAESEEDARAMQPGSKSSWTSPEFISCKKIGITEADQKVGIILKSFNAG